MFSNDLASQLKEEENVKCISTAKTTSSDNDISLNDEESIKAVITLEKPLNKMESKEPLLENNLTKLLPEQISEIASDSETDSDQDLTNLLDDPSPRSSDDPSFSRPSSCIFVASLAATLTDAELNASVTKEFKKYGKIVSVKVLRDPANRPYAFVQYASDEDALNALSQAQGTTLNNRNIRCERAKVNRTVFISSNFAENLDNKLTVERVVDLMSKFGELEQVVPSRDQLYKKNYYPSEVANSWFIQYAYRDDAIRAYLQMKLNYEYMVEWAQNVDVPPRFNLLLSKAKINELEKSERERLGKQPIYIDNKSVFIGQLNFRVTKQLLSERFGKYGEIENCNLIHKQDQVKCFAFIKYKSAASAAKALERENHSVFMDKILHVQIREISNSRRNSIDSTKSFQGPLLNLAPPPLNMGRRASTGSFNKYVYPIAGHMQSTMPAPYMYASIQESRRNTINTSSTSFHGHGSSYNPNNNPNRHYTEVNHNSETKTYMNKNTYPHDRTDTGTYGLETNDLENGEEEREEDGEAEDGEDDGELDDYDDADETHLLEHESNSSFTTFSAGTGTTKHNNMHGNIAYHKHHGYKKRRNLDMPPRMSRMDGNFFYGPPVYYSMEYCPPSGGPIGPGPSHLIQAPAAHLTGQCPPSQHSPFFYYFPMPPPTPTFNNPFPHDHPGGFKYLDTPDLGNGKADLDY